MVTASDRLSEDEEAAWAVFGPVTDLLPSAVSSGLVREVGQPLLNVAVLMHLLRSPRRACRLSALAACADSALPRMSRIVSRLESDGLVRRVGCPGDGRAVDVTLTRRGADLAERARPVHDRLVRRLLVDALTPEQLGQLREISAALLAHLHFDADAPVDRQRAGTR